MADYLTLWTLWAIWLITSAFWLRVGWLMHESATAEKAEEDADG